MSAELWVALAAIAVSLSAVLFGPLIVGRVEWGHRKRERKADVYVEALRLVRLRADDIYERSFGAPGRGDADEPPTAEREAMLARLVLYASKPVYVAVDEFFRLYGVGFMPAMAAKNHDALDGNMRARLQLGDLWEQLRHARDRITDLMREDIGLDAVYEALYGPPRPPLLPSPVEELRMEGERLMAEAEAASSGEVSDGERAGDGDHDGGT